MVGLALPRRPNQPGRAAQINPVGGRCRAAHFKPNFGRADAAAPPKSTSGRAVAAAPPKSTRPRRPNQFLNFTLRAKRTAQKTIQGDAATSPYQKMVGRRRRAAQINPVGRSLLRRPNQPAAPPKSIPQLHPSREKNRTKNYSGRCRNIALPKNGRAGAAAPPK